jgi:hypothetical protein
MRRGGDNGKERKQGHEVGVTVSLACGQYAGSGMCSSERAAGWRGKRELKNPQSRQTRKKTRRK